MSKIKVNSIEAATGSTITIPSGQTLDISATTLTLPSTVVTTTGTQTLTNKTIGVSQLSGTIPTTIGGTGLTTLGTAAQVLRVNSGATALEFGTVGTTAGQVIQVLSATDSTERTTTSTSFVTASNTLSVTITPSSASNKIFVIASAAIGNTDVFLTLYRDATNLGNGTAGLGYGNAAHIFCMSILDSPATTSAITYQVYFRSDQGTTRYLMNAVSKGSITVMEVKG